MRTWRYEHICRCVYDDTAACRRSTTSGMDALMQAGAASVDGQCSGVEESSLQAVTCCVSHGPLLTAAARR